LGKARKDCQKKRKSLPEYYKFQSKLNQKQREVHKESWFGEGQEKKLSRKIWKICLRGRKIWKNLLAGAGDKPFGQKDDCR
jgi:hypothetical protein